MEQSLSKKIVLQAVKSFNKQGIISTSLRQIAKEIGISDGHLRYYFKTKEDLIIGVYQEMVSCRKKIERNIPKKTPLWKNIILQLEGSLMLQSQFSGLYSDSYQLFKKYPKLKKMHREIKQLQKVYFIEENKKNIERGIFDSSLTELRLFLIQEQFAILIDTWVLYYLNESKNNLINEQVVKHFTAVIIGSFLPYLNKELQKEIEVWMRKNIQKNIFDI